MPISANPTVGLIAVFTSFYIEDIRWATSEFIQDCFSQQMAIV